MSSSEDAIKRVIAAFERSDWSEIDVRWGDVRVHLSTGPGREPGRPAAPPTTSGSESHATETDGAADDQPPDPAPAIPAVPPVGAHVVVAPSPGILWRSPEPGAPPYVDVGDHVDTSDTVCIIEVMKLMSHLKAGVRGEIVAIFGANGVAVRKDQPLFAISPADTPPPGRDDVHLPSAGPPP